MWKTEPPLILAFCWDRNQISLLQCKTKTLTHLFKKTINSRPNLCTEVWPFSNYRSWFCNRQWYSVGKTSECQQLAETISLYTLFWFILLYLENHLYTNSERQSPYYVVTVGGGVCKTVSREWQCHCTQNSLLLKSDRKLIYCMYMDKYYDDIIKNNFMSLRALVWIWVFIFYLMVVIQFNRTLACISFKQILF